MSCEPTSDSNLCIRVGCPHLNAKINARYTLQERIEWFYRMLCHSMDHPTNSVIFLDVTQVEYSGHYTAYRGPLPTAVSK